MKKGFFIFLLAQILLVSQPASSDECAVKISKSDIAILLLPFNAGKNTTAAPTLVMPVLLKEYLSHVSGIAPVMVSAPATADPKILVKKAKEAGTRYVLGASLTRKGGGFELLAKLYPSEGDLKEVAGFAGVFEYPTTMNDTLIALTEKISVTVGKKFNEKKVLPYLNRSSSGDAYQLYASAMQLMASAPDKAVPLFQQALQKDYNYVPSYVGLSEALARAGATGRAQVELLKAKLLNPILAKTREDCIESIIKKKP